MQVAITDIPPEIAAMWVIAVTLALVTFVFWYHFIYTKTKQAQKRTQTEHFDTLGFISDGKPSTFEYYDAKWTNALVGTLILILASILAPPFFGIAWPLNAVTMTVGLIMSMWVMREWFNSQNTKEREANQNTTYISADILFPELSREEGLLIKHCEIVSETELSTLQCETIVDGAIEQIKLLPKFDPRKVDLKQLKERWVSRMDGVRLIRIICGPRKHKYHIALVARHSFANLKTTSNSDMIDETIHVSVPLAPMFLFQLSPMTRNYLSINEKWNRVFEDRKMGMFLSLFDIAQRESLLLRGEFTAPNYLDGLFGQYLHHIEENTATARSMTDTETSLTKAHRDLDEKDFFGIVASLKAKAKEIEKSMGQIQSARKGGISLGKWGRIVLVCGLIGLASLVTFAIIKATGG